MKVEQFLNRNQFHLYREEFLNKHNYAIVYDEEMV